MANRSQSQSQFAFAQIESAAGTINNSTGTATVANADAFRIISMTTKGDVSEVQRPSKTTTLSQTVGIIGRKPASYSVSAELAGSGAAGTAPDIKVLLQALFGKAPAIVGGTSVTYTLDDLQPTISLFNFRDPATVDQLIAFGAVVNSMRVNLSDQAATAEFSGQAKWVLSSLQYATTDATGKGGLTSFPTRPSAPVFNGTMALGLYGSITIDGTVYTTLRSVGFSVDAARSLDEQTLFNGGYAGLAQQGKRSVSIDFELTDEDLAALNATKLKCVAKTAFPVIVQIGSTAGNIWTFTFPKCVFATPDYTDGSLSWGSRFSGRAVASTETAKDEISLVLT